VAQKVTPHDLIAYVYLKHPDWFVWFLAHFGGVSFEYIGQLYFH